MPIEGVWVATPGRRGRHRLLRARKRTVACVCSWPTAGIHRRQLTGSLIAAPMLTMATWRSPSCGMWLSRAIPELPPENIGRSNRQEPLLLRLGPDALM